MTPAAPAPRVVALVPTWKAARFIAATLESLGAQTHPNLEILISDDASPDDTATICECHAARDPRFRVIRQPRNLGWVGNVNALLRVARGDHLLFAFQDDLPEPTYVERCVAALAENPAAIMAFSDIVLVHQDGTREEKCYTGLEGVTSGLERARRLIGQRGSWWIPNRGVFRSSAADVIGGLRRHRAGEFSADWPWLIHMALLGEMVRIPECLVTKIYQTESLSRSWDFGARSWTAVTLSAIEEVRRARIPARDKATLAAALVAFDCRVSSRVTWRRLRRSAGAGLRWLGLRRPPTAAGSAGRGGAGRTTE
ncbi:MAG: glycosyltransferase family 2 protein [Candidatus Eisenbacteria bacterium]